MIRRLLAGARRPTNAVGRLLGRVRHLAGQVPLTPLGWALIAVGVVAWLAGARLDWIEVLSLAAGLLLAAMVGIGWTLRRAALAVRAELVRERVVVGEQAVVEVEANNPTRRRVGGAELEVPVGKGRARFETPPLAARARWSDAMIVPTQRRSVIDIGPPKAVLTDPLGVARRETATGEATQLFVHPITVRLPSLSSGWLRDLEGQTTNDLSPSDVAFHTLRQYVPGDDRRHIHWRSSAKVDTLMTRQFVDTRRSHLGLLLSLSSDDWRDQDEFELGAQVAGSLGRTALLEGQTLTAVAGGRPMTTQSGPMYLDELAGVDPSPSAPDLAGLVRGGLAHLRGASIVVIVTGSPVDLVVARRHAERFGPTVRVAIVSCEIGAEAKRHRLGRLTALTVGDLSGLARVLHAGGLS